jgi:cytoskeleton protein RodZ
MSEVAQALGQRLKAERERRGVSAQKMADDMHLDAWVIEALEAGDYQRIGAPVYARGHLKKYATMLGLSAADIAAGYETKSVSPAAPVSPSPGIRVHSPAPATSNLPWPQLTAVAAVVLLAGGIFWWRPWHLRPPHAAPAVSRASAASPGPQDAPRPSAEPSAAPAAAGSAAVDSAAATEAPEPFAAAPSPAQASNTSPSAVPSTVSGPAAGAALSPAAGAPAAIPAMLSKSSATPGEGDLTPGVGRALLRLSFSADSWVDVYDYSGRRIFGGRGRANSVKTIAGVAPFRVYLGFASGVQLQMNDRAVAIGPQFVTGDVARFEAGADGVLRRDSHDTPNAQAGAAAPRG